MYSKSKKQIEKLELIQEFSETELITLQKLAFSKNREIRRRAAVLLGQQYDSRSEMILYHLSFDRDELVRLEATDSLSIGKTLSSLQRLEMLCYSSDCYIRFFAIQSHYDVYMNLYENEDKKSEYLNLVIRLLQTERNLLVKLALYKVCFLCGDENALKQIADILINAIKTSDYSLISPALNLLDEVIDEHSKEFIEPIFPFINKLDGHQAALLLSMIEI